MNIKKVFLIRKNKKQKTKTKIISNLKENEKIVKF